MRMKYMKETIESLKATRQQRLDLIESCKEKGDSVTARRLECYVESENELLHLFEKMLETIKSQTETYFEVTITNDGKLTYDLTNYQTFIDVRKKCGQLAAQNRDMKERLVQINGRKPNYKR